MTIFSSVSDLSSSWNMRRMGAMAKADLSRVSQELASGELDNKTIVEKGRVGRIFGVDQSLKLNDQFSSAVTYGKSLMSFTQAALGRVEDTLASFSIEVLEHNSVPAGQNLNIVMSEAEAELGGLVSALNASFAGITIFSGADTRTAPVADASVILNDVNALVAAAPDAATVTASLEAYFMDAGGGFETNIYQGAPINRGGLRVSETFEVDQSVRADDPAIRRAIMTYAAISAVESGSFNGTDSEKAELITSVASGGLNAASGIIKIQERLGHAEERLERADVRLNAERYRLMQARNELAASDQFEKAAEMQSLEIQLQTIYTVTTRASNLSLVNFLR